jgi:hypothetical protein
MERFNLRLNRHAVLFKPLLDGLRRVLLQSPIARLDGAELALDHPKRMLHLGSHAVRQVLHLVQQRCYRVGLAQLLANARAHGSAPPHRCIGSTALDHALVARISGSGLRQCGPSCRNVTDGPRGRSAFWGRAIPTLSNRPRASSTSLTVARTRLGQFVFLQPVAKAQDAALIGHTDELLELRKLAIQRVVKDAFFHGRLNQRMGSNPKGGRPVRHSKLYGVMNWTSARQGTTQSIC